MKFILYKIYYDDCLVYLGRTTQELKRRLHGHFFKTPMMRTLNINCVSKIEYAEFNSEADMFLYEIYYINKLKPPLNRDDKARDEITVYLPEYEFKIFDCNLMDKWKSEVRKYDLQEAEKQKQKNSA